MRTHTVRRPVANFGTLVVESSDRGLRMVTLEGFDHSSDARLKPGATIKGRHISIKEISACELAGLAKKGGVNEEPAAAGAAGTALEAADALAMALSGYGSAWDRVRGLPIDEEVLGGGFTCKVLKLLRYVPEGRYVTYGELAKAAGSPRAARAVGSAMASNPLLIVVPCHRVYGAGGRFTGFGGGLDMKAALAGREQIIQ